jgi:D-alanyl-D-alanine carboxypeptidase/D-alanyl-D-alanine-endopeptidase (penicillin-binding protein 4)
MVGFGHRIGRTLRVPGRGMRRSIVLLVVLVTAGATGSAVALSTPSVIAALHPTPVADTQPALPRLALGPLVATAPVPTVAGLTTALGKPADAVPGTFTGVVLDPASNQVLWQRTPGNPLVPGSTAKLITTAAALLTLNPTSSLVTKVVAGGEPGAVVLVGGGDPTLTALPPGKATVYPDPTRLSVLADQVKKATGGRITKVMIDTTRYRGPGLAPGWDEGDIAGGDITPITPLMLDGGRIDPTQQDGARVPDPAQQAGLAFAKLLGVGRGAVVQGTGPPNAEVLGTVTSAPVAELVETLLQKSDNVLAEVLARETAIARGGEPSFDGAVEATMAALTQAGIPTAGAAMVDGSGLSTQDRVPAQLLAALVAAAAALRRARPTRSSCVRCSPDCRWRAATARSKTASRRVSTRRRDAGSSARRPARSRRRAASQAWSSTRTSGCSCSPSCRTARSRCGRGPSWTILRPSCRGAVAAERR